MTRALRRALALMLSLPATVAAQPAALSADELLRAVDRALPLVEQARQEVVAAEGELREAAGAFDVTVGAAAKRTRGFYDNDRFGAYVEQPLAPWGLNVYGGYRASRGLFAPYDGLAATLSRGELSAGFDLPLLKHRAIDGRRAARAVAELGVDVAGRRLEKTRLTLFKDALAAYWDWAAAGQQLRIAGALLDLAEARDQQLADAVALGQTAAIERTDNRRAILQRRAALVAAERAVQRQAIDVSLYLRGPDGAPQRPALARVPPLPPPDADVAGDEATLVAAALQRRPELAALAAKRRQQEVELRLAENSRLPSLTWFADAARDLGDGTASRAGASFETGLSFSLPVQRRQAIGKVIQARATLAVIDQDIRWIQDTIRAEVQDALSALAAARAALDLVREEVAVARQLEGLERDRFALGDSTQFVVNLRELATADAAVREARALADYQKALVAVEAATGRLVDRVPRP
ncbi:MAG: TolC family protein [Vicinamibacterales bacterium]